VAMHPSSRVFGSQIMPAMGATRHFGKGATKSMDLVLVTFSHKTHFVQRSR